MGSLKAFVGALVGIMTGICCLQASATGFSPYMEASGSSEGELWGYVRTRPEASMFWWLYHSTHPDGYVNRPLVLWLQGGPGLSGTGLGNFAMFGPVDQNGMPRNHTWIQTVNMLYIDSPVTSGFSYLHDDAPAPASCDEISEDLLHTLATILLENSELRSSPIYVFGQSYGGKMAANFAYHLHMARKRKLISCNFKGVGLGNSWVSPYHITASWPEFLLYMSLIDEKEYAEVKTEVAALTDAIENHNRTHIGRLYTNVMDHIFAKTNAYNIADINFNNPSIYELDLNPLMNGPVRDHLGFIPSNVTWAMDGPTYGTLWEEDFWKTEVYLVDSLLQNSDIQVIIYSGQYDVICCTKGAIDWVNTLRWEGMPRYHNSSRQALQNPDTEQVEMFVKAYKQLKFYWILEAGHAVPVDAPDTGLRMINRIIDDEDQ